MPRFFVSAEDLSSPQLSLTGAHAAHCKVLRLACQDTITLCDGLGHDAQATILQIAPDQVLVELSQVEPSKSEATHGVTIFMAYSKGDKLEHVIQKATELGAYAIVAFPAARCVAKVDGKSLPKKLDRWQKIAVSAAEQSGRGYIPQVSAAASYEEALSLLSEMDCSILLYENEENLSLGQHLSKGDYSTVGLMTGPEGGFDPSEIQKAVDSGVAICTLGPRILRCETAPLCALSATMFALGELG